MEQLIQQRDNLLSKINIIVEKLEKIDDETTLPKRQQIILILSNLGNVLESCDEKYLLKQILDPIATNLSNIETYINRGEYTSAQNYLAEIIKNIAFLNNANGKQSLRGYQSAVNKSIRLLEKEVESSIRKLEELEKNKEEHEKELSELNDKYEKFAAELLRKQEDSQHAILEDQQNFKKEYGQAVLDLKEDISKTKTSFQTDSTTSLANFETEKAKRIEELDKRIDEFINQTNIKLEKLEASATEKIGHVSSATYSNTYQKYSDQARIAGIVWYVATFASLAALVGCSIYWFIVNKYANTDYLQLIARVCASAGFAIISRYSAIQASKNKVVETKLRKIQLQMATFDAFVASLEKGTQDELKIELARRLVEQEDWITHDKNEIDSIKELEKVLNKIGHSISVTIKEQQKNHER